MSKIFDKYIKNIGIRLNQERLRLGLNQTECANIAQIKMFYVSEWERSRGMPDMETLRLWGEYGMNIHFLLTGQHDIIKNDDNCLCLLLMFLQQANQYQIQLISEMIEVAQTEFGCCDEQEVKSTIGQRIQEERLRLVFNKSTFASYGLTTYQTVTDWENGLTQPRLKNLLAWHQQTDFDLGYVLTGRKEYPWLSRSARQLIQLWPHMQPVLHKLMLCMIQNTSNPSGGIHAESY